MKLFLKLLFGAIFVWMTVLTIRTMLQVSLWDAWNGYAANPWAVATLWDAYSGFTIFYCWVFYKEDSAGARLLWLVLVMALGNIATSGYLLLQLFKLRDDEGIDALVRRRAA